ncbi:dihydroneopterin aldolase [Bergeyella sp. RCAD1439]|uniref:dihydroneopterin aldolase n=1 Tax=Bergeyella anatis TaxID=3113737 RepID=UPI002E197090|nr:dihydroneopterin aldolase [Bergeyella sp. RCAD1439]
MKSRILLEELWIYAFHGVLPEETLTGTYYLLDVELHADLWKASQSDSLSDTVNYAEVNAIIHEQMRVPSKLLEHVAGRIMASVSQRFPEVEYMRVKITKTAPPMEGEMRGVSVELERAFR